MIQTTNEDGSNKFIARMDAIDYIEQSRAYLDYLEEHITSVHKALCEVYYACEGTWIVGDDATYHSLVTEVKSHDVSKLSQNEFTQYRQHFYPVDGEAVEQQSVDEAWAHHKANNHHHHESLETYVDVIHMVIDWTAMGYKFGDTAEEYYNRAKDNINLAEEHEALMLEIFDCLRSYRRKSINIKET